MDIVQAIVLGIVQGLGEFLPISSSGHLIILPKIFNWQDQGMGFDVALHLGTLLALLMYFFEDYKKIISDSYLFNQCRRGLRGLRGDECFTWQQLQNDVLFIILLATVPGVVAGVFLGDYIDSIFRDPTLVACCLFIGGLLLFVADKVGSKKLDNLQSTLNWRKGLLIGVCQALAIFPGMSRSGITITAGLFLGMNRKLAARFSFLLATPIVLGAGVKEFFGGQIIVDGYLLLGVSVAAISGYAAIKYMLKFVENCSYNVFVVYRVVLALIIMGLFGI